MSRVLPSAALGVINEFPGGSVLSALVVGLLDEIDQQKEAKDKLENLRQCLPATLADLKEYTGRDKLIDKIIAHVEAFNLFIQGHQQISTVRLHLWGKRATAARAGLKEFEDELKKFTTELQRLQDLVSTRTLHLAAQTNETSKETLEDVKEVDRKVGELADGFKNVVPMLEKWLTENAGEPAALSASRYSELQDTLDKLRGGNDMEEAQKTLVRIALKFLREGDERYHKIGVETLEELVAHPNARDSVMDNPSTVRTLVSLAMERPGDKPTRWMLEHLVERTAPFFEQLEPLSRVPGYIPTIAATGLVPWIVKSAKPMTNMQGGRLNVRTGDENALQILLAMVECDECKPAIAEAGGIATLVDTYPLLEMSMNAVNELVFHVIRALVSLANDSKCREQFAEAHGEWPLLHFVYRCATIPSTVYQWASPDELALEYDHDTGSWYNPTKPTAFNRSSIQCTAVAAGHALWAITTQDDAWKRRVLYLSALKLHQLYNNGDGEKNVSCVELEAFEKRYSRFDAILGWLRMASNVEETRYDELYCSYQGEYWSFPIFWSLLMDAETSFTVAEWCFGGVLRQCVYNKTILPLAGWGVLHWHRYSPCSACVYNPRKGCLECASERPIEKWVTSQMLSESEDKIISSISSYLALPLTKCKSLTVCWRKILELLETNEGDHMARPLSVLWICGDLVEYLEPKHIARLEKVCERAVAGGRIDDIFWAVCLLLSMPKRNGIPISQSQLALAMKGVEVLLKSTEWVKFVFLAKYMLAREWKAVQDQGLCSISFVVTCYLRLRGGEEWLDDDSFFQSKRYQNADPTANEMEISRWLLGQMWLQHKTQIVKECGAATLKAMHDCIEDDYYKSEICEALHAIAIKPRTELTLYAAPP